MKKEAVILISLVIFVLLVSICIADENNQERILVKDPNYVEGNVPMFGSSSLPPSWQNSTTCSMIWAGNCSEGPPESFDNTFDDCDAGLGGDESINEVYLNTSSLLIGDSIEVTCNVMIWGIMNDPTAGCGWGWQGDRLNIYYRNSPTAEWQRKFSALQVYSCLNYSVSFVPDSVEGVHQARCVTGYKIGPNDECASGDFYDNDDVNFTVYAEFISITLAEGAPIDFGTNAIPGSVDFPALNNPLIVTVDSNINFDITTKADDADFTSAENSFPISNMKWQLTPTSTLTPYSTSEATVYSNQTWGNFSLYHKITIPNGQKQGTYSADIVLTAKKSV